ncbi:MAG: PSD1 and planctomycete cytochrome C domain-containing protein [Verrucomicrobiota bacterium]|nr:PSD1 and planctomycete cytochrome C domain-containing protein [Verrucomicrobiota bacterium]MDG1891565.1 PSD1 and planctomycete cytochrome C domain-containing protein [Verrucomicrobiota bacterium]
MAPPRPHSFGLCFIAGITLLFLNTRAEVDFNRIIRPILSEHCLKCHGPDDTARKAGLRLDVREGALSDLGGYAAVVPGKPEQSALIMRIESSDPEDVMPPAKHGNPLAKGERTLIRDWIISGANYETHWAFVAPHRETIPQVIQSKWPDSPIDYFILAQMESQGLQPSSLEKSSSLIRRVSLDLVGLPPTPQEVDRFKEDTDPDAFEKVVDRLLGSESFGEHWARMWLDLARYADTRGYEKDKHRDIWRYRDWVIDAFNADMPYDRFTLEQLAGDLLPKRTSQQVLATAFHRNTMTNEEGGTDNEEFRVKAVKDRVDTTIQVWMGLTMGCAKCHSHKYDPISLNDYYAFYAFFNQTEDNDQETPLWPTPNATQGREVAQLKEAIARLEQRTDQKEDLEKTRQRLEQLDHQISKTPVMLELPPGKQRTTRIQKRGNFLNQGEIIEPTLLPGLGIPPVKEARSRLDVATWLISAKNPLTARVLANRVWARLFGRGLVETEEDFGSQGLAPSHPKLLDWLALEFREKGWSLKKILRVMVLSKTYRQTSESTRDHLAKDPSNRWLSRGPRFRLSAEAVRDQALAASGLLTRKVGGPSVMPHQPPGVWKTTYSGEDWKNATGGERYRRAIYTYLKRTSPHPAMTTFDAGSGEICQIRRVRTNTPLQALVTLNDLAFVEAAGALSQHMQTHGKDLAMNISEGFRRLLARVPEEHELDRLMKLYHALKLLHEKDPDGAQVLMKTAGIPTGDAAMIGVANVLLNLDEFLMK